MKYIQTITITRKDLIELYKLLNSLQLPSDVNAKFTYGLYKNITLIQPEIDALRTIMIEDQQIDEFEQKRLELCNQYAQKDENGNPIIQNNEFIIDNIEEFTNKFKELETQYKDVLEKNKQKIQEINNILNEEIEQPIYCLDLNTIPNGIGLKEMKYLSLLIKNEEDV